MRRRTFLACLAGGTALSAGCNASLFGANASREVYNPSGHAAIRPLDEPYVRQGLTSDSEQYLYARLFRPGDSPPVTETQDAAEFSDAVDDLSGDQFAVLTNLRTAAAAPAYLWPTGTDWSDGRLRIELERRAKTPVDAGAEAVGVALTVFDVDGEPPAGADIVFPSGAISAVGTRD